MGSPRDRSGSSLRIQTPQERHGPRSAAVAAAVASTSAIPAVPAGASAGGVNVVRYFLRFVRACVRHDLFGTLEGPPAELLGRLIRFATTDLRAATVGTGREGEPDPPFVDAGPALLALVRTIVTRRWRRFVQTIAGEAMSASSAPLLRRPMRVFVSEAAHDEFVRLWTLLRDVVSSETTSSPSLVRSALCAVLDANRLQRMFALETVRDNLLPDLECAILRHLLLGSFSTLLEDLLGSLATMASAHWEDFFERVLPRFLESLDGMTPDSLARLADGFRIPPPNDPQAFAHTISDLLGEVRALLARVAEHTGP